MDPINKLIESISATQKKRDELEMDMKLLDSVTMSCDIELAKLEQRQANNLEEIQTIRCDMVNLQCDNLNLQNAENVQRASRSKMLLTLESMSTKKKEFEANIRAEELEQNKTIESYKENFGSLGSLCS